jgi:3-hydroxyacyl-[acyl-carrier-protein] dehydratase
MPISLERTAILEHVKTIMRRDLKLRPDMVIDETTPFFSSEADLDSLDILLLLTSIEKEFAIKIPSEEVGQAVFQNLKTLTDYLQDRLANGKSSAPSQSPQSPAPPAVHEPLDYLPHQPPFRFVSKLLSLTPNQSAEGIWAISGQEDFFAGHFPGRPIVPGVLVAEALAQLSGLVYHGEMPAEGKLARVDVRFNNSAVPPADIRLHSRLMQTIGLLTQYEVHASNNGAEIARGTITLSWLTQGDAQAR